MRSEFDPRVLHNETNIYENKGREVSTVMTNNEEGNDSCYIYKSLFCTYIVDGALAQPKISKTSIMNSTKVQNPRHKMQVALLAEPKTPLESSVFI